MSANRIVYGLLLAWAIAFFGSFAAFALTPSKDFGLSAGWNKVGVWMTWQAFAFAFALSSFVVGFQFEKGSVLRRRSKWPVRLTIGFIVLAIAAGFIGTALMNDDNSSPSVPSRPATEAPDTQPVVP